MIQCESQCCNSERDTDINEVVVLLKSHFLPLSWFLIVELFRDAHLMISSLWVRTSINPAEWFLTHLWRQRQLQIVCFWARKTRGQKWMSVWNSDVVFTENSKRQWGGCESQMKTTAVLGGILSCELNCEIKTLKLPLKVGHHMVALTLECTGQNKQTSWRVEWTQGNCCTALADNYAHSRLCDTAAAPFTCPIFHSPSLFCSVACQILCEPTKGQL